METSQQLDQQAIYLNTELKSHLPNRRARRYCSRVGGNRENPQCSFKGNQKAEEAQVRVMEEPAKNKEQSEQIKAQQMLHNEKNPTTQGEMAGLSQQLGAEDLDTLVKEAGSISRTVEQEQARIGRANGPR